MLAFTFQIYFDFSGYSDMAVGLARLFGVSLPFNFNSPYKAKNVSDFWRRWHITLSQWLRDYLYINLGGNRHGLPRTVVALLATTILGGLWHGAGWTFLLWGLVHGLALAAYRFFPFRLPATLSHAVLFVFVALTWVLFRSADFAGAMDHYVALVAPSKSGIGAELWRLFNLFLPLPIAEPVTRSDVKPEQVGEVLAILGAAFLCFSFPNAQQIALWMAARKVQPARTWEISVLWLLVALIAIAHISPDAANEFIYFQF